MRSSSYNSKSLRPLRTNLRNNATQEEKILWNYLKHSRMGFKFRRQVGIGNYIVDFFCPELSIVIELDDSQHLENQEYDQKRDIYLASQNYTVLRFWNGDIKNNLDGVLIKISEIIHTTPPRFTRHPS